MLLTIQNTTDVVRTNDCTVQGIILLIIQCHNTDVYQHLKLHSTSKQNSASCHCFSKLFSLSQTTPDISKLLFLSLQYTQEKDRMFKSYTACILLLFVFIVMVHIATLPRYVFNLIN